MVDNLPEQGSKEYGTRTSKRNYKKHRKVKIDHGIKYDKRKHGFLLHANDADPILTKVRDATGRVLAICSARGPMAQRLTKCSSERQQRNKALLGQSM